MKPKITIQFNEQSEIRMGSPFKCAELKLHGAWVPDLPRDGWQDMHCHSDNGNILCLVKWDIDTNNDPGFRLVMIDAKNRTVEETERISGCCESLEWLTAGFGYRAFGYRKPNNGLVPPRRHAAQP